MLSSAVSYLSIATDFSVRCHLEDAFLCSARLYKIAHRSAIRGAKPNRYSGPTTARCPKSSALAEIRMCGRRRFLRLAAGAALLPADRVLRGRKPTVASTPVEHSGCDSGRDTPVLLCCSTPHCRRRIFAERFDQAALLMRSRRTMRLDCVIHHLGLALGGRPAASFSPMFRCHVGVLVLI
jgi:hypothetical protein